MHIRVDRKMITQAQRIFGRRPGSPPQTVNIVTLHRSGMI